MRVIDKGKMFEEGTLVEQDGKVGIVLGETLTGRVYTTFGWLDGVAVQLDEQAYWRGRLDRQSGKEERDCPYADGTLEKYSWLVSLNWHGEENKDSSRFSRAFSSTETHRSGPIAGFPG